MTVVSKKQGTQTELHRKARAFSPSRSENFIKFVNTFVNRKRNFVYVIIEPYLVYGNILILFSLALI